MTSEERRKVISNGWKAIEQEPFLDIDLLVNEDN